MIRRLDVSYSSNLLFVRFIMIMVGAFMVAVTRYFWITSRDAVGENTGR